MSRAVRGRVRVQEGGRIELQSPELRAGEEAEVIIILADEPAAPPRSNLSFLGSGRGAYSSVEEIDRFIRAERDRWD